MCHRHIVQEMQRMPRRALKEADLTLDFSKLILETLTIALLSSSKYFVDFL